MIYLTNQEWILSGMNLVENTISWLRSSGNKVRPDYKMGGYNIKDEEGNLAEYTAMDVISAEKRRRE